MADLNELRKALEGKVNAAIALVESARADFEYAQGQLRHAEESLASVRAGVEQRLSAIKLVEEMVAEAGQSAELNPYRQLTQEQAMREALRKAGQALNSTELAEALRRGGYPFKTKEPANTIVVAANLNRNGYFTTAKENGRTLIGLAEWGPDMDAPDPFEDLLNDRRDTGVRA